MLTTKSLSVHYSVPEVATMPPWDEVSKFLKSTSEKIKQYEEIKKYPKRLLSFRKELSAIGVKCSFNMYDILTVRISSPVDRFHITCMIREMNSADVILYSPLLPYTIVFENCETGIDLCARMIKGKLLINEVKETTKEVVSNTHWYADNY